MEGRKDFGQREGNMQRPGGVKVPGCLVTCPQSLDRVRSARAIRRDIPHILRMRISSQLAESPAWQQVYI